MRIVSIEEYSTCLNSPLSAIVAYQWRDNNNNNNMEHEGDNYTIRDWCFWYGHQRIIKGTGGLENKRTSGDHPNYYIIENGQNTENSSGDSRRLAVTQNPVKDHQLTLMWKTLNEWITIINKCTKILQ